MPDKPRKTLTWEQLKPYVPYGRTTIYRMIRDGTFPKPHYRSANRRYWYEDEIVAWQERGDHARSRRGRPRRKKH